MTTTNQEDIFRTAITSAILNKVTFSKNISVFGCICITIDECSTTNVTVKLNDTLSNADKQKALSSDIDDSVNILRRVTRRRSKSFDILRVPTDENENVQTDTGCSAFKRSASASHELSALTLPPTDKDSENPCVSPTSVLAALYQSDKKKLACLPASQNSNVDESFVATNAVTDQKQRRVLESALKEFLKIRYHQKQAALKTPPVEGERQADSDNLSPVPPELIKLVALKARLMGITMPNLGESASKSLCKAKLSELIKDIGETTPQGVSELFQKSPAVEEDPNQSNPDAGITKQKRLSFTGNEEKYQLEQGAFAKAMQKKLSMMNKKEGAELSPPANPKRASLFRTGSAEKRKAFVEQMISKCVSSPRKRPASTDSDACAHAKYPHGSPAKMVKMDKTTIPEAMSVKPLSKPASMATNTAGNANIFRDLLCENSRQSISKPVPKRAGRLDLEPGANPNSYTFKPIKAYDSTDYVKSCAQVKGHLDHKLAISEYSSKTSEPTSHSNVRVDPQSRPLHSFLSQSSLESLTTCDSDAETDALNCNESLPFSDIDSIPDTAVIFTQQDSSRTKETEAGKRDNSRPDHDESSSSSVGSAGFEFTTQSFVEPRAKLEECTESPVVLSSTPTDSKPFNDKQGTAERIRQRKSKPSRFSPSVRKSRSSSENGVQVIVSGTSTGASCVSSTESQNKDKPRKMGDTCDSITTEKCAQLNEKTFVSHKEIQLHRQESDKRETVSSNKQQQPEHLSSAVANKAVRNPLILNVSTTGVSRTVKSNEASVTTSCSPTVISGHVTVAYQPARSSAPVEAGVKNSPSPQFRHLLVRPIPTVHSGVRVTKSTTDGEVKPKHPLTTTSVVKIERPSEKPSSVSLSSDLKSSDIDLSSKKENREQSTAYCTSALFVAGAINNNASFNFSATDVKMALAKDPWPKLPAQLSLPQQSCDLDKERHTDKPVLVPVPVESNLSESENTDSLNPKSEIKASKKRARAASVSRRKRRTNSKQSESWAVPVEYRRPKQGSGRSGRAKPDSDSRGTKSGSTLDSVHTFKMKKYWLEMYGPVSPMIKRVSSSSSLK